MKILVPIVIAALLTSCAAGPHLLPATAQAHLDSAKALPDEAVAVGCTATKPCVFQIGTYYPSPLDAHMAGAERCCADCIAELQKVDRPGVDTITVIIAVISGALVSGLAVAAGYEIKEVLKK